MTLTLKLDLLLKNFNLGCYLMVVATWWALLSSDIMINNSYYLWTSSQYIRCPWWFILPTLSEFQCRQIDTEISVESVIKRFPWYLYSLLTMISDSEAGKIGIGSVKFCDHSWACKYFQSIPYIGNFSRGGNFGENAAWKVCLIFTEYYFREFKDCQWRRILGFIFRCVFFFAISGRSRTQRILNPREIFSIYGSW